MSSSIPLEHIGLIGMKDRAKLLGGLLSINTRLGKGTSIRLTFPVSSGLVMKRED